VISLVTLFFWRNFMAKSKNKKQPNADEIKEFAAGMLTRLNKKFGSQVYYDLSKDEDPAKIERWYSTQSWGLDWICSGMHEGQGGIPGGRFVEIYGPESIGKSHICYQIARGIQQAGGICLYIDTELATSINNLKSLGVDISERFIYAKVDSIEGVFEAADEFLKEMAPYGKTVPIGIFWDSLGGIGSRIERDMDFDDIQRPGLNAKQITFGMRKITPAINESAAAFVIVNQWYDLFNVNKYDTNKHQTKGGSFVKYAKSVALEIKPVTQVWPKEQEKKLAVAAGAQPCGIRVRARTAKNKVAAPFRTCEIDIHFGVGLKEHMPIWESFIAVKEIELSDGRLCKFDGGGSKRKITIFKTGEEIEEIKFARVKTENTLMEDYKDLTKECYDALMSTKMDRKNKEAEVRDPTIDDMFAEDEAMEEIA
jgi:recombination protein RecA